MAMSHSQDHRLSDIDEQQSHATNAPRFGTQLVRLCLFTVTALSLFTLAHSFLNYPRTRFELLPDGLDETTGKPRAWFTGPCGRSASEAIAAGCQLDSASMSWLTPDCHTEEDREDAAELNDIYPMNFTMDYERKMVITDVVKSLLRERNTMYVFADWAWHSAHCAYMARRFHRKILAGEMLDSYIASTEHAEHCSHIITQNARNVVEAGVTRVFIKYPDCI